MNVRLYAERPLYPIFGLLSSLLIAITGLLTAPRENCILFLGSVWAVFFVFGCGRACLAVIPYAAVLCAVFSGITYAVSRDGISSYAAVNRILAVSIAVIPGLAVSPVQMVRNFSMLKIPRIITLGMMITLNFFPLLGNEIRQVREAMKTRGADSIASPRIFYRAFFIPLVVRLVNISDTLALSVQTRGFTSGAAAHSVYKPVRVRFTDVAFILLILGLCAGAVFI